MNKAKPWTVMGLLVLSLTVACSPSRAKSEREVGTGVALMNGGSNSEAIQAFERATAVDAKNANAWYYLGYARSRRLNNFQSAVDALSQAVQLKPQNAEYAYQLAYAQENAGNLEEAVKHYEIAAALDPSIEGLLYRLGQLYERQGEFRGAMDAYSRSIHAAPYFTMAWIALGSLYAEFGAPDAALLVFENGIENNPTNAELYTARGIALFEQDRVAEAIAALEKAVSLGDERSSTSMTLALAILARGEMSGSKTDERVALAHMQRAARACSPTTEGTRCAVIAAKLASMERER